MSWMSKRTGRPRELKGGFERVSISLSKWMKEKIERELGDGNMSKFIRNVLRPILEELDLPEKLQPDDWFRVYESQVGEPVIPLKRRLVVATLGAILPLLAVGALISLGSRRCRELNLRHGEEDRTLHKTVNGDFIDVCDRCFYNYGYDQLQTWEHSYDISGATPCFHCGEPATRELKQQSCQSTGAFKRELDPELLGYERHVRILNPQPLEVFEDYDEEKGEEEFDEGLRLELRTCKDLKLIHILK